MADGDYRTSSSRRRTTGSRDCCTATSRTACDDLGVPVMVLDPHPDHMPVPNTTELAGPLT
jgi:hypothetical protein